MNLRSKLGLAAIGLLCVQGAQAGAAHAAAAAAATTHASAVKVTTVHAADTQSVTDKAGNVYDAATGLVVPPPTSLPADVESATSSNLGGNVTLQLNVHGSNPNPLTDPGWLTNTPGNALTAVEWILVTSTGGTYLAVFTTHATTTTSGLSGQLFDNRSSGVPIPVSCVVTPTYSLTSGYSVSFASSCIGAPASYQWNGLITYHPATYRADDAIGKAAPEQGSFPTKLIFAPTITAPAVPRVSTGYWLFATDGGVFTHGSAHFYGSTGSIHLNKPIVGSAPTTDGQGYWLVASDGGIFAFGDAKFYGSTGGAHLNEPIVGMAATPDGSGYWLVASDGGIFAFGDANFLGSTGGQHLNQPIVGMAPTPDGNGYWLVASDGGIFAFGDAKFYGSTGGEHLNKPILAVVSTAEGNGYWLLASDGGIFAFGDATFHGSTGGEVLNRPIVGLAATADGGGYWLVASDGGIFAFGDATFYGSQGSEVLNEPIVTMAASNI